MSLTWHQFVGIRNVHYRMVVLNKCSCLNYYRAPAYSCGALINTPPALFDNLGNWAKMSENDWKTSILFLWAPWPHLDVCFRAVSLSQAELFFDIASHATHWQYNRSTVFIQTEAHAIIDAHPLHHQALGTQKWVELMTFHQIYMDQWWAVLIFSDDVFEVRFQASHFVPTSCLAHAQWASIEWIWYTEMRR